MTGVCAWTTPENGFPTTGCFTDDVTLEDQAHLAFLRSPYPHAKILSIDTAAAQAMPGVLLVVTGAQLFAAGVKPHSPSAFCTKNFLSFKP